jgi:hypothetical protein
MDLDRMRLPSKESAFILQDVALFLLPRQSKTPGSAIITLCAQNRQELTRVYE